MDTDLKMESLSPISRGRPNKTCFTSFAISVLAGLSLPILIPLGQMLLFAYFWGEGMGTKRVVDRNNCSCSCWDTVFKGPYENGIARYKHVYFNSTWNTFKMWGMTILFFIGLYETVKHLVLLQMQKRLRWPLAFLLVFSLHSHYYAWWGHWNYLNDQFYSQWGHQIFFTVTELLSSALVLSQVDRHRVMEPLPLILIGTVAAFHISSSTWDQFFHNVIQLEGRLHQISRDIVLMATDCIQVFVAYRELRMVANRRGVPMGAILGQRNHLIAVGVMTLVMFLYVILCPS